MNWRPIGFEGSVGVDMGGTKTAVGHVVEGRVVTTVEPARPDLDVERTLAEVARQIVELGGAIERVGLGFPGRLEPESDLGDEEAEPIVLTAPNLPRFVGTAPGRLLGEALDALGHRATIRIANDAEVAVRAAVLKEFGKKPEQTVDRVLYLTVSTGVGGALWDRGRTRNLEPGLSLRPDPDRPGVLLEHLAGGASMERDTGRSARELAEAARHGDATAQQRLDVASRAVGMALADLLSEHRPIDRVVVGGGLALGVEGFLDRVRETLDRAQQPDLARVDRARGPRVQAADPGETWGVLGALELASLSHRG